MQYPHRNSTIAHTPNQSYDIPPLIVAGIFFKLLYQRWYKNLNLQIISDLESNIVRNLEIIQNLRYFGVMGLC